LQIKITELPPEADWYQVWRIEGIGASARSSGVVLLKRACAAHLGKSPGPRTEQGKATLKHGNTPNKHSQHPTLGAHPDKSEWFHCTRIHTIVDGLLGISEIYY
jgi:hypothetical protein